VSECAIPAKDHRDVLAVVNELFHWAGW
jgi:hypothetical protein